MLIDLLSTSNYVSYNITLAKSLGLHTAIYLNEILNINDKAIRKDKVNNNCFILDREYITGRTTLDEKEQLEIDSKLIELEIIHKDDPKSNCVCIDLQMLTSIIMSEDEGVLKNVEKLVTLKNKKGKQTKTQRIVEQLKDQISTTNPELRQAYYEWIDGVVLRYGWMTKENVRAAQQLVDNFANHNLDTALTVVKYAAKEAYREMNWAIEKVSAANSNVQTTITNGKAILSTKEF